MIIIAFGHCHGNWHGQIKLNSMKFVLFLILGTYALSIDWVDFFAGWNGTKFVSFTTRFWGRLTGAGSSIILFMYERSFVNHIQE